MMRTRPWRPQSRKNPRPRRPTSTSRPTPPSRKPQNTTPPGRPGSPMSGDMRPTRPRRAGSPPAMAFIGNAVIALGDWKTFRFPSWPGIAVRRTASLPLAYARPSTSFLLRDCKDVDARHKAGHDDELDANARIYRSLFQSGRKELALKFLPRP